MSYAPATWRDRICRANKFLAFARDHFAELFSWRDIVFWIGPTLDFPLTRRQLDRLLAETRAEQALRACWMAEQKRHVQLRFDWRNSNATIGGVAMAPTDRGRGLAAPPLTQLVDHAFVQAGIERLDLGVFTINTRAIRLYDRLGFTREAVLRSCVRVGDERWDRLNVTIVRSERRRVSD